MDVLIPWVCVNISSGVFHCIGNLSIWSCVWKALSMWASIFDSLLDVTPIFAMLTCIYQLQLMKIAPKQIHLPIIKWINADSLVKITRRRLSEIQVHWKIAKFSLITFLFHFSFDNFFLFTRTCGEEKYTKKNFN